MGMPTCGSSGFTGGSLPNPDPTKYTIINSHRTSDYLIICAEYHGCTNYNGRKIMVYKGIDLEDLTKQNGIDPHFSEKENYHSPIARFEPTLEGLDLAMLMIRTKEGESIGQ